MNIYAIVAPSQGYRGEDTTEWLHFFDSHEKAQAWLADHDWSISIEDISHYHGKRVWSAHISLNGTYMHYFRSDEQCTDKLGVELLARTWVADGGYWRIREIEVQ
jgi:hypothetical protein